MRVLITGARGQLGRALVAAAPTSVDLVAAERSSIDLSDPRQVREAVARIAPDVLINAAAYTAVDRAESQSDMANAVNGAAVGAMNEALAATGGRLIHVSTDFVFDGQTPRAYCPDDELNPLSVYGSSKAAGEDAAGQAATIVRTAWVYGAGGANFVNTMLRLMRERDEVRVVADQIGAPTWTGGLAAALWSFAEREAPGIWHWTDAGVASWYDFAVAIQDEALAMGMLDRAVPVIPIGTSDYPTPARRPAFSLLDSSATRTLLETPPVHWRINLRRMLAEQAALEA